ncbi:beta strand repeat-containing protein [Chiayiivirga flava]|uniref:Ribosomal protein S11 n=1 Tax=Chiayiivirga flava TaxID=659595 RepID=A0A7W8D684_9GAMM|nr:choice-of-anchor U domain-containing protein [Chiayiivirga flava]MBB5208679.1 ribosomal protein S11 [Chiayiivirga flava]
MQATDHSGAGLRGGHRSRTARRWLLGLALGGTLLAPAAQAQLVDPIGFETCPSGAALDAIACAGVATLSTPGGPPVAVAFDGRFGSSGSVGLFSDSGPVTIEFSPTVSDVRIDVLEAGAGATVEAFAAGGASLGSVPAGAAAQIVAAGIARIVITDPDGEFALDQLQTAPEGAVAGCPVYQDGCAVDVCTVPFRVGGDVVGLDAGETIVLQLNGADDLAVSADGAFQFATILGHDSPYDVTIATQPAGEVCTVARGSGIIDDADIDDVLVACGPLRSIGGTVSGLAAGASVTLQNNGGDDLVVSANGSFAFANGIPDGFTYDATVLVQPTMPTQVCSIANGSGTATADVTSIAVQCVTQTFAVGGTVSGLAPGNSVTLANNGGDTLVVNADGGFTFATPVPDLGAYNVTVQAQPTSPNQVCTVSGGSGTIMGAPASVAVTCVTQTYTIGGSVSGLAAGNSVQLLVNGGDALTVPANGAFTFATPLDDGSAYAVTVSVQPTDPDQTCSVTGGSGTLAGANVTSIGVSCVTQTHAVGGTVSGLVPGNSVTLVNNGGDALVVPANGSFTFATPVADGDAYLVAVSVQPTSPNQVCSVANGGGTIDGATVTTVAVSCVTDTHTVGGNVAGLAPGNSVTLAINGGETVAVPADGSFVFPTALDDGSSYAVTVSIQPTDPDQTCTVGAGSGTLNGADITNIAVSCSTDTYTVGGTVSGLAPGNSVTLANSGGDALTVSANGAFAFATSVEDEGAYLVTVTTQPTTPNQTCTVANGSGTVDGADITSVTVTCVTQTYTIGGTVGGLAPGNSVTLTNNGGDALVVSADGVFTFATALDDGSGYAVVVSAQPTDPDQTCTVGAGSGTLNGANVTNIAVTCSTDTYAIGGSVSGLTPGNSVTLANNGGDALVVSSNGTFVFATPLADGSLYAVTVSTQPTSPNQTCTVASGSGSGTVGGADITSVTVTCVTETYTVGGTVSGLAAGTSVTLTNNGGDALVVTADGVFTFATALDDGSSYAVAVSVQPTSPDQTCSVTAGSGTLAGAGVDNVLVSCATQTYTVGGTVSGLAAGNSVTLTNNGGDALVVGADGSFTFASALADGSAYAVAVSVQPTSPNQVCSVAGGSGNLAGADVTTVSVTCETEQYTVGGSVSGLDAGNSVTLTNNGGDMLMLSADGAFTFATALDDGSAYSVAVSAQPDGQSCSVAAGSGTLAGADVTTVLVDCAANTFTVTPSAGAGGTLDPGTPQTVAEGDTATFDVLADTGYDIAGMTGCDGNLVGTQYVTGAIDADCTVQATFVKRTITGTTPAGPATASVGGDWVFAETGNGPMQSAGFIPASGHPKSPATLPADVVFPTGLIDFVLVEGQAGTTASVQIVFAQAVPAGAQFQVYGPSAGNPTPHWQVLPVTVAGNVVTLQPTDGSNGDGDVSANAVIPLVGGFAVAQGVVDPPPASAPAVIPATSTWALLGLALMLGLLGLGGVRAAGSRD